VQARTGSGGSHYLFRWPDFVLGNTAGKVGQGLDTRGEGGQIVVAPSRSAKGSYHWVPGHAPWEHEIAEAPEWLLDLLRTRSAPAGASGPDARGYFPPANATVLEAARKALLRHGPAVDGDGGGLHAVQAGAILTHDFALSDDEAWPLFVEWNETCEPPFDADDDSGSDSSLRERLRRGRKYGKGEYGARRTMDALERGRKLLNDWQTSGTAETGLYELLPKLRAIAFDETAKRGTFEREVMAATGLKAREIMLPKAVPPVDDTAPQGAILVTTRLHEVADQSVEAIKGKIFARNGVLCEVVTAERVYIHDLETSRIQDLMSQSATYARTEEAGPVTVQPPENVARVIGARRNHKGIRVLEAITTAPIFLADGSILQDRGYNAQARVYLEPSVVVDVPEDASQDDARAAVALFADLLCDFRFAEPADFSSWLAALLSPLVKSATANAPAPLTCVSAPAPGAGKSLLTDVLAQIVTGGKAEIRPYSRDPAEWAKKLTSFVKAGAPVGVFDNCNGPIGDESLDRLLTASTWSDRILGASEAPPLPIVTTWLATGNNIEPQGDTVRRVLMVRQVVETERPQERTGFRHNLEGGYALEHRAQLLSAALTILRAYHLAGRPAVGLQSWGSFTTWSSLVRGALVWAGCADPFLTQQRAARELHAPDNETHDFWISIVESCDGTKAKIAAQANQLGVDEVLGNRESLTAFTVRRFLGRFVDKPRQGRKIQHLIDPKTGQETYRVVSVKAS
jgi:hypothetical protein